MRPRPRCRPSAHPCIGARRILYLCPAATLWSAAYIAMTEGPVMVAKGDYVKMVQHPIPFMLSATLGVVVTISAMGVIKYMSSLTFKVLGQARNLGVILLSVYIFQNVVTLVQVTGYLVQIGGFQLYQVRVSGGAVVVSGGWRALFGRPRTNELVWVPSDGEGGVGAGQGAALHGFVSQLQQREGPTLSGRRQGRVEAGCHSASVIADGPSRVALGAPVPWLGRWA
eukprot:scaffold1007_cov364-Prasinococcus_capsulatus_cf.AAC.17